MHIRGMSDWSLAEIEDVNWEVFDKSDDHIVPHQGGFLLDESSALVAAHSDSYKKPHRELNNYVDSNMCSRGSMTNSIFWGKEDAHYTSNGDGGISLLDESYSHTSNVIVPTLCDEESTADATAKPSQEVKILEFSVNECNAGGKSDMFCSNVTNLETIASTNGSRSCLSSLTGASVDVADLSFLKINQHDRDNDLAYYDWPDISNFEDIDKIFRNWDSTFGQEQIGSAEELSWFSSSSSNTIYNSEVAFGPVLQSSSSDLGASDAELESHRQNVISLPKNVVAISDNNRSTSSGCTDQLGINPLPKSTSSIKEKSFDEANKMKTTRFTQFGHNYCLSHLGVSSAMIESQQSSEDKQGTKLCASTMPLHSDVSTSQKYDEQLSQQEQFKGSSSSYMNNVDAQSHLKSGLLAHHDSFPQMTCAEVEKITNSSSSFAGADHIMCYPAESLKKLPGQLYMPEVVGSEFNVQKLNLRQQLPNAAPVECQNQLPTFQSKGLKRKLPEFIDDSETVAASLGLPTADIDTAMIQESSGMTPVPSNDISENSFRQLQDVMHQLDVRTKLCIRDSLYRLARSAKQRHSFSLQCCGEGVSNTRGFQVAGASNRKIEYIDVETNTNPIDRSIAHLLFHKPVEAANGGANDSKSLESYIINGQVLVPEQFGQHMIFGGCSELETDLP